MDVPILIVGAGMTGMMAAIQCARRHLRFSIVERGSRFDRAGTHVALHPRAVACLERLGVAAALREHAALANRLVTHASGGVQSHAYPLWVLERDEALSTLRRELERLGTIVETETELVDVRQDDRTVLVSLLDAKGERRTARFAALLACDGAESLARRLSNFEYLAPPRRSTHIAAQASVIRPFYRAGEAHVFRHETGDCALLPRPGGGWIISLNAAVFENAMRPGTDVVLDILHERGVPNGSMDLSLIHRSERVAFRVARPRDGRIIVCGSAAHGSFCEPHGNAAPPLIPHLGAICAKATAA